MDSPTNPGLIEDLAMTENSAVNRTISPLKNSSQMLSHLKCKKKVSVHLSVVKTSYIAV